MTFDPNAHYMELADGTRMNNVALKRGDAEVCLQDREGRCVKVTLRKILFIPSYPQNIFSVKAAITNGAKFIFQEGQNELIHKEGTVFLIQVYDRLHYLKTVNTKQCVDNTENDMMSSDKVSSSCDVKTWHEILGHCNTDEVLKLPNVVEGMQITGNIKIDCSEDKFTNTKNKKTDAKA